MTAPPMAYYGGKTRLASRIASLLPPHEHYVEPFAGSLAVLLAKPPSLIETVNDLDQMLMALWQVLRDKPAELARACALTPHSRADDQYRTLLRVRLRDEPERLSAWLRPLQSNDLACWCPIGRAGADD